MSRMPRINIENALYFISSKGDRDENIFREGSDYAMYLELLKKNREQYKFKLFGYCLAPNQINLLIELTGDTTISQIMHGLNSTYTKYFGSKYNRSGHLFQERYKMVLVEKEPNILGMSAYMNLLPKLSGIAQDPASYPYSSCQAYLYIDQKSSKLDIGSEACEVIGYLKGKDYGKYISGLGASDIQKMESEINKKTIVGSDEFIESIKTKMESEKKKAKPVSKRFMTVGTVAVIVLAVMTTTLYLRTFGIKESFKKQLETKEEELSTKLKEEKKNIRQDLDEKYRADMVSFEAAVKRLQLERQKTADLEKQLKAQAPKK